MEFEDPDTSRILDKDSVRQGYDELAARYASARSDDGSGMDVLRRFLDDRAIVEPDQFVGQRTPDIS